MQMQDDVGSNPAEGKICFSPFTPFMNWNVKNCFVKLILKYKYFDKFKNQNSIFNILDDIKLKRSSFILLNCTIIQRIHRIWLCNLYKQYLVMQLVYNAIKINV